MDKIEMSIKASICDRLQGWELVDFLQVSIVDIVDAFEDEILENIDDVLELVGMRILNDGEEDAE